MLLTSLAPLFLTVAVLPAYALSDTAANGSAVSLDLFSDTLDIVAPELVFKSVPRINVNGMLETTELLPAHLTDVPLSPRSVISAAERVAALTRKAGVMIRSILIQLMALPTNPAAWFVVFSPWALTLLFWNMRPPLRRRLRRRRP